MQKPQIDRYEMVLAVENHFEQEPTLWNSITPIVATKTLLSSKINELRIQIALQLVNKSGITEQKAEARTGLENQALIISAAISGYAVAASNTDLYNGCHYSKTELSRFRDAEIIGVCVMLHQDAEEQLTNLLSYGITMAVLTTFSQATTTFGDRMKKPEEATALRKKATEKIARLLPETIALLAKRLDNNIVMLQDSQSEFVQMYKNLRGINKSPRIKLSLTILSLDKETREAIAGVNLEIIGRKIKRVSSPRGINEVKNLVAGKHKIKVSHPEYGAQTVSFTVVNGETTRLVMELERN